MENMSQLLQFLGYSHSVSKAERNYVRTSRMVFLASEQDRLIMRPTKVDRSWESTIELPESSIGWNLGLRPEFVEVKLNNAVTIASLADFLGMHRDDIRFFTKKGALKLTREVRGWLSIKFENEEYPDQSLVVMKFSTLMPQSVINKLMAAAMNCGYGANKLHVYDYRVLPAHPSWISMEDGFRICVGSSTSKLWKDVCANLGWDVLSAFQRAGKDIWGTGKWFKPLKLLVVAQPETKGLDGHFVVREASLNKGRFHCLVRGVVLDESGKIRRPAPLLKGRMIVSNSAAEIMPNGMRLPAEFDGWTTADQFKYVKVAVGETLSVRFLDAKSEVGHEKDWYKTNLMMPLMAKVSEDTMVSEMKQFDRVIKSVAKDIARPDIKLENHLKMLASEQNGGIKSSELCKLVLGMATEAETAKVFETTTRKLRSRKVNGSAYPSIVFAANYAGREITPEKPGMSTSLWLKASSKKTAEYMVIRYPVTCYQSYLGFEDAVELPGISDEDVMVLHPSLAAYLQGDDDDHVLILWGMRSEFRAGCGEQPLVRAEGVELLEVSKMSISDLYFYGWRAQSSIGLIFNSMLKAVAAAKDLGVNEATMERVIKFYGSALDTCAQAIKKPYKLPDMEVLNAKLNKLLETHRENVKTKKNWLTLAEINTNKGKSFYKARTLATDVHAYFGIEIQDRAGGNITLLGAPTPELDREVAIAVTKQIVDGLKDLAAAKLWHKEFLKLLAKHLGEDKLNAGFRKIAKLCNEAVEAAGDITDEEREVIRNSVISSFAPAIRTILDTYAAVAFNARKHRNNPNFQMALSVMDGVMIYGHNIIRN
jgi:hypothetical protein